MQWQYPIVRDPFESPAPRRAGVLLLALLAGCAALAACSTTEGFGKDVKDLGGNIEDSAAKNK